MIPLVVASERGRAQTGCVATRRRGCRTATLHDGSERNTLEKVAIEGDSPLREALFGIAVS